MWSCPRRGKWEQKEHRRELGTQVLDQLEPDPLHVGNTSLMFKHRLGTDLKSDAGDFYGECTKTYTQV